MQSKDTVNFEIAGYKFFLFSIDKLQLNIDPVYFNFLILNNGGFDLGINIHKGFSSVKINIENVFAAKIPETNSFEIPQRDWNVCKDDKDFYISIFSPSDKNKSLSTSEKGLMQDCRQVETILKVNNSKEWDIYIHHDNCKDNIAEPLLHPVGSLILYYLTALHGDIFLHGSGIFSGNKGRIFTGFSGAGKSTMAAIWEGNGASVIHDDRLILRKGKNNWNMYNTPVYLNDIPKNARVDEIFLVNHASENRHKDLTGAVAAARIFACCIQHDFDKQLVENLLKSVADLCNHIQVFELGFVPDNKIIEYIENLKNS